MKKNIPLIIAIALPVVLILAVLGTVLVPKFTMSPEYDFIYTDYYYQGGFYNDFNYYYDMQDGFIVKKDILPPPAGQEYLYRNRVPRDPSLYFYDVKKDTSRKISYEEVRVLRLEPGPTSPDGFLIENIYSDNGIFDLFGSNSDRNGLFLVKNAYKKKLKIQNMDFFYGNSHTPAIGWIKNNSVEQ
ncbi:MAG: hypothetical protein AAB726_00320 [Patescibacteria group bacterium]